jgi:glucose-6-phosphate 1-dehydrogenase
MTDESFRTTIGEAAKTISEVGPIDPAKWNAFSSNLYYSAGEYGNPDSYTQLAKRLLEIDKEKNLGGNRLFYLSTPPEVYPDIVEQLGRAGLARPANPNSWVRIIIEKPFGRDLASAKELNKIVLNVFEEKQVYRIDHYLGKDTVQNLLVLRFGNGIFEPLWNRNYVDHVQITASETLGVERRGGFYETAGALRDMIQSHVLQLTSLMAVEPPASFDATAATKNSRFCNPSARTTWRWLRNRRCVGSMRRETAMVTNWPATAMNPVSIPNRARKLSLPCGS